MYAMMSITLQKYKRNMIKIIKVNTIFIDILQTSC